MKNGIDKHLLTRKQNNFPTEIIVHHTGGTDANPLADTSHHTFEGVKQFHKSKGWDTIGYHVFIERDGTTYQGRPFTMNGAHCIGKNTTSIGVCLAGNFDATSPSEAQIASLRNVIAEIKKLYPITKISGHRAYAKKTCPGKNFTDSMITSLTESKCSIQNFTTQELFTELLDRFKNIK